MRIGNTKDTKVHQRMARNNTLRVVLFCGVALFGVAATKQASAQSTQLDLPRDCQRAVLTQRIGLRILRSSITGRW
jgi:hypothetical protein